MSKGALPAIVFRPILNTKYQILGSATHDPKWYNYPMLTLILFLIAGAGLAYISSSNLMPVSLYVGPYVLSDVPLFYVIIGSVVTGLALSYIIYITHAIGNAWVLRGTKKEISQTKDEVLELTKRVHQLELENEKLKHSPSKEPSDRNAL